MKNWFSKLNSPMSQICCLKSPLSLQSPSGKILKKISETGVCFNRFTAEYRGKEWTYLHKHSGKCLWFYFKPKHLTFGFHSYHCFSLALLCNFNKCLYSPPCMEPPQEGSRHRSRNNLFDPFEIKAIFLKGKIPPVRDFGGQWPLGTSIQGGGDYYPHPPKRPVRPKAEGWKEIFWGSCGQRDFELFGYPPPLNDPH